MGRSYFAQAGSCRRRPQALAAMFAVVLGLVMAALAVPALSRAALAEEGGQTPSAGLTAEKIDKLLSAHDYLEGRVLAEVTAAFDWPQEAALASEGDGAGGSVQSLYEFAGGGAALASDDADGSDDASASAEDDPLQIILISSSTQTTRELLEALASMDGVLAAQPDYSISPDELSATSGEDDADAETSAALASASLASSGATLADATGVATLAGATEGLTNDHLSSEQYWLYDYDEKTNPAGTNVQSLWKKLNYTSSKDVPESQQRVIAVVDSGFDTAHEDLEGVLWTGGQSVDAEGSTYGYNCASVVDEAESSSVLHDSNGHGTHVAGLIAAEMGNNVGGSGMAPNARLMLLQVGGKNTGITSSAIICAYNYIVKASSKAHVTVTAINNSWGGTALDDMSLPLIADAYRQTNAVSIIASGNDKFDVDIAAGHPSQVASDGVIVVDALDNEASGLVDFSNYGSMTTDIAAAGKDMLSSYYTNAYLDKGEASTEASDDYSTSGGTFALSAIPDDDEHIRKTVSHDATAGEFLWDVSCTEEDFASGKALSLETEATDLSSAKGKQGLYLVIDAYSTSDNFPKEQGYNLIISVKTTDGWADLKTLAVYPKATDSEGASYLLLTTDASGSDISSQIDWENFQLRITRKIVQQLVDYQVTFHFNSVTVWSGIAALPYGVESGTSMSTPVMTGAYALLSALYPNETSEQLICRLLGAVRHDESLEGTSTTNGALDLSRALSDGTEQPVVRHVEQDESDPTKLTVTGRFFGSDEGTVALAEGIAGLDEEGLAGVTVTSWADDKIELTLPAGQDPALLYVTVRRAGETDEAVYGSLRVALDATPDAPGDVTISEGLPAPDFSKLGLTLVDYVSGPWQLAEADGVIYATHVKLSTTAAVKEGESCLAILAYDPEASEWSVATEIWGIGGASSDVVMTAAGDELYVLAYGLEMKGEQVSAMASLFTLWDDGSEELAAKETEVHIADSAEDESTTTLMYASMTSFDGKLVVHGIASYNSATSKTIPFGSMLVVDPTSCEATWESFEPGLMWSAATEAAGSLYVVGGVSEWGEDGGLPKFSAEIWRWDGSSWEQLGSLPEGTRNDQGPAGAVVTLPAGSTVRLADGSDYTLARDSVLACGLAVGDGGEADCYVYDAEAGEWHALAERVLLTHVAGGAAVVLGDGIYVLGYDLTGSSGDVTGASNLVFRRLSFTPAAGPVAPVEPAAPASGSGSASGSDPASAGSLPRTGDTTALALIGGATLGLAALAAGVAIRRRAPRL